MTPTPQMDPTRVSTPDALRRAGALGYDVFVSYSREDVVFATRLQRALQRYRPPKTLPVVRRRLRVFRDQSDLTGNAYYEAIQRQLAASSTLVVICSPAARASSYVN